MYENATTKQNNYRGFAIEITDNTPLELAMLIAESEEGAYEPVSVASSIAEAREIASYDLASRMRRLDRGENPMCPWSYKVWRGGSVASTGGPTCSATRRGTRDRNE